MHSLLGWLILTSRFASRSFAICLDTYHLPAVTNSLLPSPIYTATAEHARRHASLALHHPPQPHPSSILTHLPSHSLVPLIDRPPSLTFSSPPPLTFPYPALERGCCDKSYTTIVLLSRESRHLICSLCGESLVFCHPAMNFVFQRNADRLRNQYMCRHDPQWCKWSSSNIPALTWVNRLYTTHICTYQFHSVTGTFSLPSIHMGICSMVSTS